MEQLYLIFLIAHIVSGYTALMTGGWVMVAKKGNKQHRLLGKIFYYSMIVVSVTSIALSLYKEIIFLFHIALFVFYQAFAGFRSVRDKSLKPSLFSYLLLLILLINALFMIVSLNPVLIVFGSISLLLVYLDIKIYYQMHKEQPLKKLTWLSRHIGMMTGAYIGSLTAFLVVNINVAGIYALIVWLGPTIVLVPLMRYWNHKYTQSNSPIKISSAK